MRAHVCVCVHLCVCVCVHAHASLLTLYAYDFSESVIERGESEGVYIKVYRCLHVKSERT